jgi:hypothetical protein
MIRLNNLLLLTFFLVLISCTSNPFSDKEEIIGDNKIVTGTIKLSDQSNHGNIYIWLESFDLGTITNENGKFTLTLPSAQSQPGGGVTGVYKLYFYVVNYKIQNVDVAINKGNFLYGDASIDNSGNINKKIILDKLINVQTTISPNFITADFLDSISIAVRLTAVDSPIEISTFISKDDILTGFFVKHEENQFDLTDLYYLTNAHIRSKIIGTSTVVSTSSYKYHRCELPKGIYEIIPFIWVNQPGIPEELINNFAPYPVKLNKEYLNFPFRRINALVEVEYCDHTIEDPPKYLKK